MDRRVCGTPQRRHRPVGRYLQPRRLSPGTPFRSLDGSRRLTAVRHALRPDLGRQRRNGGVPIGAVGIVAAEGAAIVAGGDSGGTDEGAEGDVRAVAWKIRVQRDGCRARKAVKLKGTITAWAEGLERHCQPSRRHTALARPTLPGRRQTG